MLEEENIYLHKQMVDLKKQVFDLTATNEFLLDQNAQFRVQGKRTQTNVTSVTVPAVTITNTTVPPNNTPSQPPQVFQFLDFKISMRTFSSVTAS